jgi:TonB family protein
MIPRIFSAVAIASLVSITAFAQDQIYQPGNGVSLPIVVKQVKPDYTDEAKAARIQGSVWVKAVVQADGDVGNVRVTRSLDTEFGLDNAAVAAAKQWKFKPGTKDGKPVAVEITIELTFTLK